MSDNKTIMELIDEIYRNYTFSIGECIEDLLSNGRIIPEDLKKDRSLKKIDWLSVEHHTSSAEVKKIAQHKCR
ncbi:hypothetical protein KJ991_00070 [Patescibacteria group bacterium]|nr:hypothetical protein [Patescibacteria group bacterium]MBU4057665.1 hypothetical protein [Patescibacteria group bacterium]MBU4115536.1 hypothetical protein [Patescibacteria group bacterium]